MAQAETLNEAQRRTDSAEREMLDIIDELSLNQDIASKLLRSIYAFSVCNAREWELQILSEKEIR